MEIRTKTYPDGGWVEVQTLNGQSHGSWTVFRPDGTKDWERFYKKDQKSGPQRVWFVSGILKAENNYLDGQLQGTWKTWHENGQLKNDTYFEAGKQAKYDHWYGFDGELLASTMWKNGKPTGTKIATMWHKNPPEPPRPELAIVTITEGELGGYEPFKSLPKGYTFQE